MEKCARGEDAIVWFWLAQQKLCYYLTAQKTIELEKKKQRRSKEETMTKHFQRIQKLCSLHRSEWQFLLSHWQVFPFQPKKKQCYSSFARLLKKKKIIIPLLWIKTQNFYLGRPKEKREIQFKRWYLVLRDDSFAPHSKSNKFAVVKGRKGSYEILSETHQNLFI